jgi:hypothetical protein
MHLQRLIHGLEVQVPFCYHGSSDFHGCGWVGLHAQEEELAPGNMEISILGGMNVLFTGNAIQ